MIEHCLLTLISFCLGAGHVPPGSPHQEDQSWPPGKPIPSSEAGQGDWTLQKDHHQPCPQKEEILSYLVKVYFVALTHKTISF